MHGKVSIPISDCHFTTTTTFLLKNRVQQGALICTDQCVGSVQFSSSSAIFWSRRPGSNQKSTKKTGHVLIDKKQHLSSDK